VSLRQYHGIAIALFAVADHRRVHKIKQARSRCHPAQNLNAYNLRCSALGNNPEVEEADEVRRVVRAQDVGIGREESRALPRRKKWALQRPIQYAGDGILLRLLRLAPAARATG